MTCVNSGKTVFGMQEQIIMLDLEKPQSGGLGFSVIGGERGIFVKSITPGGIAEASGKLQVGDRLLKVSAFPHLTHLEPLPTCQKTNFFLLRFLLQMCYCFFHFWRWMKNWWQVCLTPKLSPLSEKLKAWFIWWCPGPQSRTPVHTCLTCPSTQTTAMETRVQIIIDF